VLGLIGNTPLVRLESFDVGPCELYVKLENHNPGGSIKDRIGLAMIEAAEASGALRPGMTIVEATAGNTGLGLALVAARKRYPLLLVIPDKMSQEKIFHLRALGAEVRLTRSDVAKGHPDYYQDLAERLTREMDGRGYFVNQFANPANPAAHEATTGPEIFAQMDGRLDAMVCGVGSGGTITGLSRYFARVAPEVEMVLADQDSWDRYAAAHWLTIRRWLDANPDDELAPAFREELSTDPVAYVRYRREYLGWGVFALLKR